MSGSASGIAAISAAEYGCAGSVTSALRVSELDHAPEVHHADPAARREVPGHGEVVRDEHDVTPNSFASASRRLSRLMRIETSTIETASSATMTFGSTVRARAIATR
jgi:hypothetical protein